jgi:hypothetical protein
LLAFGVVWLVVVIPAPRPGGGLLVAGVVAWIVGLEAIAQGIVKHRRARRAGVLNGQAR